MFNHKFFLNVIPVLIISVKMKDNSDDNPWVGKPSSVSNVRATLSMCSNLTSLM